MTNLLGWSANASSPLSILDVCNKENAMGIRSKKMPSNPAEQRAQILSRTYEIADDMVMLARYIKEDQNGYALSAAKSTIPNLALLVHEIE